MEKVSTQKCVVLCYLWGLKNTFWGLFLKAWREIPCLMKCLIKAGSLSGRPDFLSLFSDVWNKDEERSLLFILVFLLVSIYLLSTLIPLRRRRCSPQPLEWAPAPGYHLWGPGWDGGRHCPLLRRTESPSWPSPQCPEDHLGFAAWGQGSDVGAFLGQDFCMKGAEQSRHVFKLLPYSSVPVFHRTCQN